MFPGCYRILVSQRSIQSLPRLCNAATALRATAGRDTQVPETGSASGNGIVDVGISYSVTNANIHEYRAPKSDCVDIDPDHKCK